MQKKYSDYQDINQVQLQQDIDAIKETLGDATYEDFQHLLKLERWGRGSTLFGFILIILTIIYHNSMEPINTYIFILNAVIAAIFIGVGNVARWANVTHPILHGAYDKVPNIPYRYTKKGYASNGRRFIDWLDWIKPDAWAFEHNIMHHYHLGEVDDPDNIEKNLEWLHESKMPMFFKYLTVYAFATGWKLMYYAPNTLRILENKSRIKQKLPPTREYEISPFTKNGLALWKEYILPYGLFQFVLLPFLFLPFGLSAVFYVFGVLLLSEIIANVWSFVVIIPNHSADDIYQFSTPHKSQGEYYLRQIMGSVNYNTGSDLIDFAHGFLNYQVEHHLFPDKPLSFYQKMQPIVKEICKKHNLEYRQDNVFKRLLMSVELMVGNAKLLTIKGI